MATADQFARHGCSFAVRLRPRSGQQQESSTLDAGAVDRCAFVCAMRARASVDGPACRDGVGVPAASGSVSVGLGNRTCSARGRISHTIGRSSSTARPGAWLVAQATARYATAMASAPRAGTASRTLSRARR
jgi:hypothetical protein